MNLDIISLKKENDLNKILKRQRATGEPLHILFTSLWDKYSQSLSEAAKETYDSKLGSRKTPMYVVDSFNMPHSFVIFKTTKLPALVSLYGQKVIVEDYLPRIYKKLKI